MINITSTICVVVILLCSSNAANTSTMFRFDYKYNQEVDGWLKLHIEPSTWKIARRRCQDEGAVLASPLNESFLKAMTNKLKSNNSNCQGIFTGIHSMLSKGVFTSIEGVPISKIPIKWAVDEPDNYENSEDCILLLPDGTAADVNCNKTFPYICFKRKTETPVINECGTIDNKYRLELTGSCYKFHKKCLTWRQAHMICESEGGHLAIINSQAEAKVLSELFFKYPENIIPCHYKDKIMVGIYDWDHDGYWSTIHGESIEDAGYSSWATGEPNNLRGNQYCVAMYKTGLLDDIQCDDPTIVHAFVCEMAPNSLLGESMKL